jgi:ribonuclease BN (tRNA processing enzyme)
MELRVLGACGSWPGPADATSGYVVTNTGFSLCVDLGSGTFARLQEIMSPLDVGALVISHAHPDHFVDLYTLFYFRFFHPERLPRLPLYCPPGFFEAVTCLAPTARAEEMREVFDVREALPGHPFEAGPFTVMPHKMRHRPFTIGLRIAAGGPTLAYTADTGPTDEIVALASDADLLLSEATWLAGHGRMPNHLSAIEAGEYGRKAGARSLLLTHVWPRFDPDQVRDEASTAFGSNIDVARAGLTLTIG